jgi:hypothetical protein
MQRRSEVKVLLEERCERVFHGDAVRQRGRVVRTRDFVVSRFRGYVTLRLRNFEVTWKSTKSRRKLRVFRPERADDA